MRVPLVFWTLIVLSGLAPLARSEEPQPKNAAVASAKKDYDAAVKKAEEDMSAKIEAARKTYLLRLDAAMKEATRKGDLDEANTIKALKASLEVTPVPKGAGGLPEGTVLMLSFDQSTISEKDGRPVAADLSGKANDAVIIGGRTVKGRSGEAIELQGEGASITTAGNIGIAGAHARTISFWLKRSPNTDAAKATGIGWGGGGDKHQFRMKVFDQNCQLWGWGRGNDWSIKTSVSLNDWHHHLVVYDGTSVHWYVDGKEIGSGFFLDYDTADSPFSINGPGWTVDEVAVFDRALKADEIKAFLMAKKTALAQPKSFMAPDEVVGIWLEGNGTRFVLNRDGHFTYADAQPGTWRMTADALVLTWSKGRVDTYNRRDGDRLSGDSSIGHRVAIERGQ